jgi:hypothetical protein
MSALQFAGRTTGATRKVRNGRKSLKEIEQILQFDALGLVGLVVVNWTQSGPLA